MHWPIRSLICLIWFALVAGCGFFLTHLRVDTDMAAFLPRSASPAQQVLVAQFRNGAASRMVLLAFDGASAENLTAISKHVAAVLRQDNQFPLVQNGEEAGFERDRAFLWSHRYLLSDQVDADRFTMAGLQQALRQDLVTLSSSAGFLVEQMLAKDPTGEMLHLVEQLQAATDGPERLGGVWFSPDHQRALMFVRLQTAGSDVDGAQRALETIRTAFRNTPHDPSVRLLLTGPPVFAVEARDRIKSDATWLSSLAAVIVATMLLTVYRSALVLALAFIPVVSGALTGIAAVGLVFQSVHGVTLGFGATLIGEAVDYAVYLFTQSGPDASVGQTIRQIWPTIRLGMLTSVCGFAAMLLSGFDGFVQLGLFTITGLVTAAGVTRWVLPAMLPNRFAGVRHFFTMQQLSNMARRSARLRPLVAVLMVATLISLMIEPSRFWAADLLSLSPISPAEQRLDQALRHDLRAPDAGIMIVIQRPEQQEALQAAEGAEQTLRPLVHSAELAAFETPARYLPSVAMQKRRQAALPDTAVLTKNLHQALDGLPFQQGLFEPFIADIESAKTSPMINRADLNGTSLSLTLDSLLLRQGSDWIAVLPLREPLAAAAIQAAIKGQPGMALVNLRTESDRLLAAYLREGVDLGCLGAGAIALLLAISLRGRRWTRLAAILLPLAAAVVVTVAVLRLGGQELSVFNLFGLLLVVAIGSNYCLFLDRQRANQDAMPRVLASLLLANACTVTGFGVLAFSQTPVLHGLGLPVAVGTFLSLLFATIILAPTTGHDHAQD